jgi:hypothetical protein
MNVVEAVYHSLKRKKSAEAEAARLGISLTQYLKIKDEVIAVLQTAGPKIDSQIIAIVESKLLGKTLTEEVVVEDETASKVTEIHENVEAGTCKITGIFSTEPRSPEEIIEILKIDTSKWKLSQYWNKEKGNGWVVSALVSRVAQEEVAQTTFLEILENYEIPQIKPLNPTELVWLNGESEAEEVCGVLSLQDLHFGKVGNEDMGQILNDSVDYLIQKAYKSYQLKECLLVIGPDTLNMDTFGGTTTKGTPVENSEMATEAYIKAFDAICQALGKVAQFAGHVRVVFIPGNHDRLSSFHLLHAVSQAFKDWVNISFDIDYAERKVITYGENMLCLEHGDVTAKNNPLVYAVEFPFQWGTCKHRVLYTGHYHGRKTTNFVTENEEHGFVTRIIPALTSSDYYHYHNKYVGNKRSAIIHLHHALKGLVGEFTYTI